MNNTRVSAMESHDPIMRHQLMMIHQIIHDETWLEGERRGCYVSPQDWIVREKVCDVVLRIGQQMRETLDQVRWSDRN